jgi:hypothetical protein
VDNYKYYDMCAGFSAFVLVRVSAARVVCASDVCFGQSDRFWPKTDIALGYSDVRFGE